MEKNQNKQSEKTNDENDELEKQIQKININHNNKQLQIQQKNDKEKHHIQPQLNNDRQNQQKQQEQQEQQQGQQQQKQGQQQQKQEYQQEKQTNKSSKWRQIQQPKKNVNLFMIDFDHCDSKKCSGKKLSRFKLLTELDKKKKFKGIVLSAFGKKEVSYQDLEYAQKYGVCVVDCSWNRIQETRQFRYKHQRKLPFVTAGNPVNYGKPYQLSCAEALATSLCTIGYLDQAEYIMSKFGWSDGFWSLNPLISNYGKCKTLEQLKKQSKNIEQSKTNSFQRNYDLSDPESSQQN